MLTVTHSNVTEKDTLWFRRRNAASVGNRYLGFSIGFARWRSKQILPLDYSSLCSLRYRQELIKRRKKSRIQVVTNQICQSWRQKNR
ncbi:hypothetical protein Y032_0139g2132 [Ancylostoma ceylanicum]|uniref:Uncharacterized protein n=1 Tax=Ancylostoma ceylanicum TaxID=53326 RepID=A0A016T4M9_9BILA|nr:hypothetical protein Y032_0139g2132 [Ancylostoma ceylanicum]